MATSEAYLRPATEADRGFCWQLLEQAMRPHVEATWGWNEADQLSRFNGSFEPGGRQIIELRSRPIGALHIDAAGSPVRLINIQILPAFQRQGHGTAVIRAVLHQAGGRPVRLQVLKVNPAKALYERLGFGTVGQSETHWHMLHSGLSRSPIQPAPLRDADRSKR